MELPVEQESPNSDQESLWLTSDSPYPCAIADESDRALYIFKPQLPFVFPYALCIGDYITGKLAAVSSYPKWPESMRISDDGKYACGMGTRLSPSDTFYCVDLENDISVAPIISASQSNLGWVHAVFLGANLVMVRDRKSLCVADVQSLIAKNVDALETVYTSSTDYPFIYQIPGIERCDDRVLVIASGQNAIDSMKKEGQQWKVDAVITLVGAVKDWGCSGASRTFWYATHADSDRVHVQSIDSGSKGAILVHNRAHRSATFSPDGKLALFAAYYGCITCLDVRECTVVNRIASPGAHCGLNYIAWKKDRVMVQSAHGKRYDSLVLAGLLRKSQEAKAQKVEKLMNLETVIENSSQC